MDPLTELQRRPLPDDVIGAVFIYSGEEKLPSDLRRLQRFFYDLSHEPGYSHLLRDFSFSEDRYAFPFSAEIEPALGRLQNRGIINAHNPAFDWYGVEEAGKSIMENRVELKFDAEERALLEAAGRRLAEASANWPTRVDSDHPATTTSQRASAETQ